MLQTQAIASSQTLALVETAPCLPWPAQDGEDGGKPKALQTIKQQEPPTLGNQGSEMLQTPQNAHPAAGAKVPA